MKIGGVKEKTMAAQRAGAKVLIFPSGTFARGPHPAVAKYSQGSHPCAAAPVLAQAEA